MIYFSGHLQTPGIKLNSLYVLAVESNCNIFQLMHYATDETHEADMRK